MSTVRINGKKFTAPDGCTISAINGKAYANGVELQEDGCTKPYPSFMKILSISAKSSWAIPVAFIVNIAAQLSRTPNHINFLQLAVMGGLLIGVYSLAAVIAYWLIRILKIKQNNPKT